MDVRALIGDRLAALPEELMPVIDDIVAGKVRSLIVLVELDDDEIGDLCVLDMNGSRSNRFAVLGAMAAMQRDYLRAHIASRVEYAEPDEKEE